jgi:hypothetical protein
VAQWLRCCATNRKLAGSIPAGVNRFFIAIKSFRSHYGPGVDSASNRNEYQKYFLGGRGGWCVRLTTLPPSCAVVTKSGSLNFLEHFGPVQACNGTTLPLPFTPYLLHFSYINQYHIIGCEYPSSFMYYKYERLNWSLQIDGVFLYNISLPIYIVKPKWEYSVL